MEKRSRKTLFAGVLWIILGVVLLILLMIVCNSVNTGTIRSQTLQGTEGSFYVFYTNSNKKYVNFLEDFNEEKYEIVDITKDDGSWHVTYKVTE